MGGVHGSVMSWTTRVCRKEIRLGRKWRSQVRNICDWLAKDMVGSFGGQHTTGILGGSLNFILRH